MNLVLFLCTGNYYRSRFAEILFNRLAEKSKLSWRAESRGLAVEMAQMLPGVISPHALAGLEKRQLTCDSITRAPTQLLREDLLRARMVVALKEAEHRPLLGARFPGWEDRVEYWHVHDIDGAEPEAALLEIERQVQALIEHLSLPAEHEIFGIIGEAGFAGLVAAFYRQVPTDSILGPMYPRDDLDGAEARLRDFLIQRFGGPTRYSDQRGHPRLRMRHAPFPIDRQARDRWVALMDRALDEQNFPIPVRRVLQKFLHDTATFMINR